MIMFLIQLSARLSIRAFVAGACLLVSSGLALGQDSDEGEVAAMNEEQESTLEIREASNLEQLLQLVQERQLHWSRANSEREKNFADRKANQDKLLNDAKRERTRLERISAQLEATFQENEIKIGDLQDQLNERLGTLRELFGVLQQVSGDARGVFQGSIVSAQLPNREAWLEGFAQKMGASTQLATIAEIENLWILMQQQMTATGQISRFPGIVTEVTGEQTETDIVRIGAFNLVADGEYVNYNAETGSIVALSRQPSSRFEGTVPDLLAAPVGTLVGFGMDPTRGSLLSLLIQSKTLVERIQDGGAVGAVIIVLGLIGIALALLQLLYLTRVGSQVRLQMSTLDAPKTDNPLGRILQVGSENRDVDVETLELKLSEAILVETPRLVRFLPIIQVISVVSPLLGLLGTVIGMILTFQAITLFGTGDPQTMAGGISTALMTTVLGLCAAIPTVLLHAIVSSRSRSLIHIFEEQSTGIVAEQAERSGRILS